MITLRPYQSEAIVALYEFLRATPDGHPIVDTPTGSGKSVILAGFIHQFLEDCPKGRVMVLSHVKELIEQDVAAILAYWPQAPVGIYSAGLKRRERAQITVAGIQSAHTKADLFSPVDLVIIDECHLLSKNSDTMYGRFLADLMAYNPLLKVVGLSATPYRLDSGLLTKGHGRIFTDIAYSANVADLIHQGYLSNLISKAGVTKADLTGLHIRGGDYVIDELAARMDQKDLIQGAVDEMKKYAQDRQSWLIFCVTVAHAQNVADCLNANGIVAAMVCGETPSDERAQLLADFKAGRIRAMANCNVLTTGFDHPGIDMIAMLRPTQSTGLYVQIVGRGLRVIYADGHDLDTIEGRLAAVAAGPKKNTLVLDFSGNVMRHGPIDCIKIKTKKEGDGEDFSVAPMKVCPGCRAMVFCAVMRCATCGYVWETEKPAHDTEADDSPLLSAERKPKVWPVQNVHYSLYQKPFKSPCLRVAYCCGDIGRSFLEFIPIEDKRPYLRKIAADWFRTRGLMCPDTVAEALKMRIACPDTITAIPDGKFFRITDPTFRPNVR